MGAEERAEGESPDFGIEREEWQRWENLVKNELLATIHVPLAIPQPLQLKPIERVSISNGTVTTLPLSAPSSTPTLFPGKKEANPGDEITQAFQHLSNRIGEENCTAADLWIFRQNIQDAMQLWRMHFIRQFRKRIEQEFGSTLQFAPIIIVQESAAISPSLHRFIQYLESNLAEPAILKEAIGQWSVDKLLADCGCTESFFLQILPAKARAALQVQALAKKRFELK